MSNKEKIVKILIQKGKEKLNQPYQKFQFTGDADADELLNDLKNYPHAFVLACIMDRGMKAEKAWLIPYKIYKEIGDFKLSQLSRLSLDDFKKIFRKKNLHRYKEKMAEYFYLGLKKIQQEYKGDASNIWKNKPSSSTVVMRFLEFKGVGPKIATMAANILAREFKIPMKDYSCIDISPDVHVKRVFKRTGLIKMENDDILIYCARELYPKYPGIFDWPAWEIGKNYCHSKKPDCEKCCLNKYCPKEL